MDVERVRGDLLRGGELSVIWLDAGELNRLRFDASIAAAMHPGRFPALEEFLSASETA